MVRGLWRLTWLEIKIFVREPLGVIGTLGVPVLIYVLFGRLLERAEARPRCRVSSRSICRFSPRC
jgi:hypothetical protein